MEGAAAPAAVDGPDSRSGAPGSPSEAAAGATAVPAAVAVAAAAAAAPEPRKPHGVKRHHHKHNLKHRYELQETLGKGTYGKVKRATERFSGRVQQSSASDLQTLRSVGSVGVSFTGTLSDRALERPVSPTPNKPTSSTQNQCPSVPWPVGKCSLQEGPTHLPADLTQHPPSWAP